MQKILYLCSRFLVCNGLNYEKDRNNSSPRGMFFA